MNDSSIVDGTVDCDVPAQPCEGDERTLVDSCIADGTVTGDILDEAAEVDDDAVDDLFVPAQLQPQMLIVVLIG